MNRVLRLLLLAVPLTACSDSTTTSTGSSTASAVDTWRVTTVNGVAPPVPTPAGQTLTHITLVLNGRPTDTSGVGSLGVCLSAADTVYETLVTILWTQTGDTAFLTYRDFGAVVSIDTALFAGKTMTLHAKAVESWLGQSQWTLHRSFGDRCET